MTCTPCKWNGRPRHGLWAVAAAIRRRPRLRRCPLPGVDRARDTEPPTNSVVESSQFGPYLSLFATSRPAIERQHALEIAQGGTNAVPRKCAAADFPRRIERLSCLGERQVRGRFELLALGRPDGAQPLGKMVCHRHVPDGKPALILVQRDSIRAGDATFGVVAVVFLSLWRRFVSRCLKLP
jgi:hypothetical protein